MKFLAASTFSFVALDTTTSLLFQFIQNDIYKHRVIQGSQLFYNKKMTQIIIPTNTNNSISMVIEGKGKGVLFLGSYMSACDPLTLKQYKITAVLTIAADLIVKPGVGISHKTISIDDSPFQNIGQYFSETNQFISKQLEKGNVLVHCRAGISRSATIVLAFLMKSKKWRLKRALEFLRAARNVVRPNQGFLEQLQGYQRKLAKCLEVKKLQLK